jgi:hypothetical protein
MAGVHALLADSSFVEAIWTAIEPHLYWLGPVLSCLCVAWAYREGQKRRQLQGLPTSKVKGVFIGFVELLGKLRCYSPIISYLAETPCPYYRFSIEEEWRRVVTYTDSKGNTRTRVESGWTTIMSGEKMIPFEVVDETGSIRVWPEGAEIEAANILHEYGHRGHPLYYTKGPPHAIPNSTGKRKFTEYILPIHHDIFLVGQSRERSDRVEPEIAHDRNAPRFLISVRREEQIISGHGWKEVAAIILGAILAVGLPAYQLSQEELRIFDPIYISAYAGCYLLIMILCGAIGVYNSLVDIYQRVKQGFSLVDVQLKRRHDLLENLIPTVQAIRTHEQDVQAVLSELRAEYSRSGHGVGRKLIGLTESYPELRSNQNFLSLQKELVDTEDRIALAREYYVTISNNFRQLCERFPNSIIAGMARFKPPVVLEFSAEDRRPVTFQFDNDPLT